MRDELQARQIARAVEKPQGKTLHQVISEWEHFSRHGNMWHTIIRMLLATTVTGLTVKGIKARDTDWRKEKTLLDLLTLEEMERYKVLRTPFASTSEKLIVQLSQDIQTFIMRQL